MVSNPPKKFCAMPMKQCTVRNGKAETALPRRWLSAQ
jgi:hypothetical protein